MNNKQLMKDTMYGGLLKTFEKNSTLWEDKPAIKQTVNEFGEVVRLIGEMAAQQSVDTSGITQTKAGKKLLMAKKALVVASAAFAYASKQKNQTTQAFFNYTLTPLLYVGDSKAFNRCTAIHTKAAELLPAMSNQELTPEDLDGLLVAIKAFKSAIGDKGSNKGARVAQTQQLSQLFKQADELLNEQLDKLMIRFEDSQPNFYHAYLNARIVVDLGGAKTRKIALIPPKAA